MSPTLAVVLVAIVFAVVGVIGLRFMAGETRRFHREHEALMTKHREVMDSADRALRRSRTHDRNVT